MRTHPTAQGVPQERVARPLDLTTVLPRDATVETAACSAAPALATSQGRHANGRPEPASTWASRGDEAFDRGRYKSAFEHYEHGLDVDVAHGGCRRGLARCLSRRPTLAVHSRHLEACLTAEPDCPEPFALGALVRVGVSPSPLDHPLLLPALRQTVVTHAALEHRLTQARRELCLAPPAQATPLGLALAEQGRLNEFVWSVTPEEEAALEHAPDWVRAMYVAGNAPPVSVDIPALTEVSAGTSADVRDMYEANPYPAWRHLYRDGVLDLPQTLRRLAPGHFDDLKAPRLLVAGCGTGAELLEAAFAWRPASVTGFDLSRASLAYTRQMASRFGVEVELYQADIMRLDGWAREFDVVSCMGMLHHLDRPLEGWRRLLRLLRPGGVMRVGLYSETARRFIVAAQNEVQARGFPPTPSGIRAARAHLRALPADHPAHGCAVLPDFHYTSGCRDMLFHVREHRFTIGRIAEALAELNLTFLGFDTSGAVRQRYATLFGRDANLSCWDRFEQLYPNTFLTMYRFWVQKNG